MNATSVRQRLRNADPAAHAQSTLTADHLLAVIRSHDDDPLADLPIPPRARHLGRRLTLVAAVAAAVALVPVLWPGSRSPIRAPTAFGVDLANGGVRLTIPVGQVVSAARFQAALDKVHLKAKVFEATSDCTEPAQGGLPVDGYFFGEPPTGPGRAVQRSTFYPAKIPAGATLVFSLETLGGSTDAGWWLTDHLPNCVPLSETLGPVGPTDHASTPTTSR